MTSATPAQNCNQRFILHYSRKACFLGAGSASIHGSGMGVLAGQGCIRIKAFPPQFSFCSALRGRAGWTDLLICKVARLHLSGTSVSLSSQPGPLFHVFSPQLFLPFSFAVSFFFFTVSPAVKTYVLLEAAEFC